MRSLVAVEFKPGGIIPQNLPTNDPGGPMLPSVVFYFDEGPILVYPAEFFEDQQLGQEKS